MAHLTLTLQEVTQRRGERIDNFPVAKAERTQDTPIEHQPHRPEFYIPRIALRLANLRFSFLGK
jgi:hypothetical protein